MRRNRLIFLLIFATVSAGCTSRGSTLATPAGRIKVLATTTIVADVARKVAGEALDVEVLLPVGVDPHSFEPSPQDMAKISSASLILSNGAGLEEFLSRAIENSGTRAPVVSVSEGIKLAASQDSDEGEEHAGEGTDPHTWFDPSNVKIWARNIERALSAADPQGAGTFAANAQRYIAQLEELDGWIRQQVEKIPASERKLVTDHASFTYFANRYGFEQVGTLIPGYSTTAEASAQELAALEDAVKAQGVRAIFVGNDVNPALAKRVAQDTGVKLVTLYNGSLTGPDGPAGTYLDFMRYNVTAIVEALSMN